MSSLSLLANYILNLSIYTKPFLITRVCLLLSEDQRNVMFGREGAIITPCFCMSPPYLLFKYNFHFCVSRGQFFFSLNNNLALTWALLEVVGQHLRVYTGWRHLVLPGVARTMPVSHRKGASYTAPVGQRHWNHSFWKCPWQWRPLLWFQ